MITLDPAASGQTVEVPVGQVIELRLPENPSAGFRWQFAADPGPACAVVGDTYTAGANQPGAGGEHTWTLQAAQPGICELHLVYRRPFEKVPPAKSFAVTVQVQGK
ncbi:MAG: protease inhibitor I42 family protein [Acetobacteraceae bacterium]|nr:protease inhibitor I42 family protein [Acetobacteraceae bacterium]